MTELWEKFEKAIPPVYVHLAEQLQFTKDKDILFFFYLMVWQRQMGSLALSLKKEKLVSFFPEAENFFKESSLEKLRANPYVEEIKKLPAFPKKPIVFLSLEEEKFLYFNREFYAAQNVGQKLYHLKNKDPLFDLPEILKNIQNFFQNEYKSNTLKPEQLLAIAHALAFPFTVISGGPGTGKTTLVRYLLEYLTKLKNLTSQEIKIAAPTGRAAQRIKEAMQDAFPSIECQTLHRLLGSSHGNFGYNAENKLKAKFLLVDEVSMIDIYLLDSLLSALSDETQLVFLGDPNQLPPVGSGAILSDLAPSVSECSYAQVEKKLFEKLLPNLETPWGFREVKRVIFLMHNFREVSENQKLEFSISRISQSILKNDEDFLLKFLENPKESLLIPQNGCHFVKINRFSLLDKILPFFEVVLKKAKDISRKETYSKKEIGEVISFRRVLTFTREFSCGSRAINEELDKYFGRGDKYYTGRQILITQNDPNTGLFNGDIGVVLNDGRSIKVCFLRNQEVVYFSPLLLPQHESAWAITIHKAQGSEFQEVVIILPEDTENRLNNRQMLYTGITRARQKVFIAGEKEVFLEGARKKAYRENGFPFWERKFSKKDSVS